MQVSGIGQGHYARPTEEGRTRANADWPVPLTINFAQLRQKSTRSKA